MGRALGKERCGIEHLGLVVSGVATEAFEDGRVIELRAGDLFYIPPEPHDSWVLGAEPGLKSSRARRLAHSQNDAHEPLAAASNRRLQPAAADAIMGCRG